MDPQKLGYINAVRGWAILLVITRHVGDAFPALPMPIRMLTNFGAHGVQLFFLASAVTLLMSWHRARVHDGAHVSAFYLRRFLRIAPMYYAGAALYFLAQPPAEGFSLRQLLLSLTFLNAWRPEWIPTTGGWMVVPGGWSIGVEFTFYAVFPLLAALVTNLPRAVLLSVASFVLAFQANILGAAWLDDLPAEAAWRFLYFWFPNQMPVFALGFVLYFAVTARQIPALTRRTAWTLLACIGAGLGVVAATFDGRVLSLPLNPAPQILLPTLGFMAFVLVLSRRPGLLAAHPLVQRMGVLSFSAYVLHFLFINVLPGWSGGWINTGATGLAAIGHFVLLWALALAATVAAAALAHAVIEQPGIALGRRLLSRRTTRAVQEA